MTAKRFLEVRNLNTDEVVASYEVTGKSESQIERIVSGMLINMDTDNFCVDDSINNETLGELVEQVGGR